MKKTLFTVLALGLAVTANAQQGVFPNAGISTLWACNTTTGGMNFCTAKVTSGTTATQLGTLNVDPTKQARVVFTANDSAVSSLVTSTITLKLKGKSVGAVSSVSATSAGNVITLGFPGWYDGASVSVTVPSAISATNSLQVTVTQ